MSIPGNANPLLLASAAAADTAANITKSLRFNSGDSAYLGRTPSSDGNRKKFTVSCWVKRSKLGSYQTFFSSTTDSVNTHQLRFRDNDTIETRLQISTNDKLRLITDQVFRDLSAFYHVVLAYDSGQSTASDRAKLYVNGSQVTDFSTETYPDQNQDSLISSTETHYIGQRGDGQYYFNGYLADIYFIDGSALDPTSFGAFDDNGVWQAAAYSGTFGTNGAHLLDFASESTVGHDSSGNENDFTAYNLVAGVGKVFTTAKIYSVYASATVSSNYSVQYSDDNSNWTTAFSGVISNNGAFGLQSGTNPGDGSYGLRKYWRYVTGSVVSTHHPRCSRIVLSDGVSDVNIQVFTSDNTSDSGTIPAEGDTYTYTDTTAAADVDVLFDVPTNGTQSDTGAGGEVSGNYATLNPLEKGSAVTLSNGNLNYSVGASSQRVHGTIGVSSGKWYWEETKTSGTYGAAGISKNVAPTTFTGNDAHSWSYNKNGNKYHSGTGASYGATWDSGDTIGVAFDADNGSITFYKNGVSQGVAYSDIPVGDTYFPACGDNATVGHVNFGARSFAYSAPSGYKALCTTNLPTATIADGSAQFDAKLHTGNGSTQTIDGFEFSPDFVWVKQRNTSRDHRLANTIVGTGKDLRANANNAEITDANGITAYNSDGFSVGSSTGWNQSSGTYVAWCWNAGANSNKTYTVTVVSDSGNKYRFDGHGTSAVTLDLAEGSTYVFDQSDSSNSGHPLRFSTTSDGTHNSGSEYTTGVTTTGTPGSAGAKTTIVVAASAPTLYYYCSVHSGMGGQANTNSTAGSSNFDGSLQATVKANQTAGFSIVSVTADAHADGSTVGHELNTKPEMIVEKNRGAATNWYVHHSGLGDMSGSYLVLNSTQAKGTDNTWNLSEPTSSVISIDPGYVQGDTDADVIYYCFSPVAGYSSVSSFEANGSTDGPFVYLGFRPRVLIIKNATDTTHATSYSWVMVDTARYPDNRSAGNLNPLYANKGASENLYGTGSGTATGLALDILSNGFKVRSGNAELNFSGTYIYYAAAENPFQANGGLAR